jgi:23S rRNA pseudouridine1911/1915/1917 synthase
VRQARDFDPSLPHILYEDNHALGVYKPAGLLTQGDRSGEPNLMDWVKGFLAERYAKPGQVFLGLVHRLDRPVSGVMLFARTSKAASRISEQFRERSVEKVYWARVEGVVAPASGRLENCIEHTEGVRRVAIKRTATATAKPASLRYALRSRHAQDSCVVAIELETGRKHQIRAQFAHAGHPVVGDRLYGSRTTLQHEGIALCAISLAFTHPTTKARIKLELPSELLPRELHER